MHRKTSILLAVLSILLLLVLPACDDDDDDSSDPADLLENAEPVYDAALGCYAVAIADSEDLLQADGTRFALTDASPGGAAHFFFEPADLGVYLLYDQTEQYLAADDSALERKPELDSDLTVAADGTVTIDDDFISEGEWNLLQSADGGSRFLQHRRSGLHLTADGTLGADEAAAAIALVEQTDCATFPELTVDATGEIAKTTFEDGDVFGFADIHEHLFTNLAFGGGGVIHGHPFHRLGVKHAMGDCNATHGEGGRKDVIGLAFGGDAIDDLGSVLPALTTGELPEDTHRTDGYPTFSDWPSVAPFSATHQAMYYKWVERAYLSGMRLMVQLASSNQVLCELAVGLGLQPQRHDCNDMVNVDRSIEEAFALERYIDAHHGGPGKGWMRIVRSPQEAREVIEAGKLAVVLGIETSDLFNCFYTPPEGFERCTEADIIESLDTYYDKGVRVLFPIHKFDNAFSAGDGMRGFIALGNLVHTGHWSDFVPCTAEELEFDGGYDGVSVSMAGLNKPREEFDAPPPLDMSGFAADPLNTLLTTDPDVVSALLNSTTLEGAYCQNHGITQLGEFAMKEMMKRGIIIDVAHFPTKGYMRAYEILEENDYPGSDTHGRNYNGRLYKTGGMSSTYLGRCRTEGQTATQDDRFQQRIDQVRAGEGVVGEGFGFDFNGFAAIVLGKAAPPRFGPYSKCEDPQTDEGITYPFSSYAGDITFEQPRMGERVLDFNTEGLVHVGLVAELIEDVRRDGVSDEELEPLFRSAERYLQLWEKAERRAREMQGE